MWLRASCGFRPRLDTCWVVLLFCSFQRALAAPCRVHEHDPLVPRDCRPRGRSPSFARVPVPYSSAEGNDPGGRPRSTAGRLSRPGRFLQMHVFTHNEHRVTGYRTLAALASDSPPRASVIASRVPRPGAPRPAETGRDRPRRAARSRDKNPPAESCIRFAPPLFSFWQPQRAVKGRIARVAHGGVLVGFPP